MPKLVIIQQNSKMSIFFLIIEFLMLINQSFSYTCRDYTYTYNILVLNWPYQYCYHHTCKQNLSNIGIKNQWIIEGYWPSSKDIDFLNCIYFSGKDPHCYIEYPYNDNYFSSTLKNDLYTYWPQISVSNNMKKSQWQTHGTCYLSIIQTMNFSTIGQEYKIFESYFKDTIKKAKQINLKINVERMNTKNQLAQTLGVKLEQFYALCEYDPDYISQIRLCYNIKGAVGTQSLIKCPINEPNQCEFPIKIRMALFQYCLKFSLLIGILFLIIFN